MMHRTAEEGGVSRMLAVERAEVPAGGKVAFAPGSYHLMLMQPTRKMAAGDRIQVTLEFAGGQKLTAEFQVRGATGK
jgi:copper(I)-binding protein